MIKFTEESNFGIKPNEIETNSLKSKPIITKKFNEMRVRFNCPNCGCGIYMEAKENEDSSTNIHLQLGSNI